MFRKRSHAEGSEPTRFPIVRRGYDCGEVDALLVKIDAALDSGQQPSPDRLRAVRFNVASKGYSPDAVDAFIEEIITAG